MAPLLLIGGLVAAAGAAPAAEKVSIPVPSAEGRVSLGVFDSRGRLVRALAQAAPVSRLNAGLDGLVFEWDGRDEDGREAGAGPFSIRGFYIPPRVVSLGEAYHFNDWAKDAEEPLPASVEALVPLEGARYAVVGKLPGKSGLGVWVADPEPAWRIHHSGDWRCLAASPAGLVVWDGKGTVARLPLLELGFEHVTVCESIPAAAWDDGVLWLLKPWEPCIELLLPSQAKRPAPVGAILLAVARGWFFCAGDGRLWSAENAQPFREWPQGLMDRVWSLAAGAGGSLWAVGVWRGQPVVREFSPQGEILREMKLDHDVTSARLFADSAQPRFFLIEQRPQRQRSVGIEAGSHAGTWEIFCDRSILPFGRFGFDKQGGIVADSADSQPQEWQVPLAPSHWDRHPGRLGLRLQTWDHALWVATLAGLRIVEVCRPAPDRAAGFWDAARRELRVLAGREAVVEEYVVQGLSMVLPLEGGEIGDGL